MDRKVIPLNNLPRQAPLLQTKLLVPHALSGMVDRPRIHARLDEMLQGRLTLVTAPAGFGKTTALAWWVGQKQFPTAWLSLDAGDNDPVRFWTYVAAALRGLQPDIGTDMAPLLHSSTSPPWEAAISLLIDDLSSLPFEFALILDDYHVIGEPLIHETLSFLLRYAPRRLHPVIAGRTEPPLSLSRFRAAGQVAELTARDLGFVAGEVADFYRQRRIDLTGEEVARLIERTGGWAAGMQMAALSLVESEDRAAAIERFGGSDRLLAGYFLEEVFGGFAPGVQFFLQQTSILDRLCGPLCEAVTGEPDAASTLAMLARSCGFMTCLDDRWYVYHQLFAEFLHGLLQARAPTGVRGLCGRAAAWYEAEGLAAEAVDYFLRGEVYGRAAGLIERLVPAMLDLGDIATLFRWLSALPSLLLTGSPGLCVAQAWAAVSADRAAEVERWLDLADAACREAGEGHDGIDGEMAEDRAVLRVYLAGKRQDVPETLRWLTQAGQNRDFVFLRLQNRVFPMLEPSLLGGPLGGYGHLKAKARAMEAGVYLKLRSLTNPATRAGYMLIANAEALYEWNRIDAALKSLAEGMEEAQRAEEAGALVPALVTMAKIHLARGNLAAALAAAEEGERLVRAPGRLMWLPPLAALKARIHLLAGDAPAAGAWLNSNRLDVYDRLSAARAYEHITLARVLLARGRLDEAILLLERLLVFAGKEQRLPNTIEISSLLAIACDTAGRTAEGLELLQQNLALGRKNCYLRSFVDEGAPMLSLLRQLARRRPADEEGSYIRQISSLLRESPVLRYPTLQAAPARCDSLTAKELAVLRLLAQGLDRQSIAREISVALETVKSHLASIYSKLGVDGRRDAVKRAQELGILR